MMHHRTVRQIQLVFSFCLALTSPAAWAQPFSFNNFQHTLPAMRSGAMSMGDLNADGQMDVVVSGVISDRPAGVIYRNGGILTYEDPKLGTYYVQSFVDAGSGNNLLKTVHSAVELQDLDGDGDLDFVITGATSETDLGQLSAAFYRNNGLSTAATMMNSTITAFHSGDLAFGDLDNDGDPDLATCGINASGVPFTRIYANGGLNQSSAPIFTNLNANLVAVGYCDLAWADFDRDGDLDLAVAGATATEFHAKIYRNDGGTFTDLGANLMQVAHASLDWGDFDADGDPDLLLSGGQVGVGFLAGKAAIYRNDNGIFTNINANLLGLMGGRATWADYDNDGDLDVLLAGNETGIGSPRARIYENNSGAFSGVLNLVNYTQTMTAVGDLDGDYDLDVVFSGLLQTSYGTTYLQNQNPNLNLLPIAPKNLKATVSGTSVQLSWDAGSDLLTPTKVLQYNIRVGRTSGGNQTVSAMANSSNGRRYLSAQGNAGQATSFTLKNLKAGTYYWSVQTLDAGYAASKFAQEVTFAVSDAGGSPVETETETQPQDFLMVHGNFPNPFTYETTVAYEIGKESAVEINVIDMLGRKIARLGGQWETQGLHQIRWNGRDDQGKPVASGLYWVQIQAGDHIAVQKVFRQ